MKNKIWLYQLPLVVLATVAYYITDSGLKAELNNPVLRDKVYPPLQRAAMFFTDWKFRIRGPQAPKNNIVIVEVDSAAVSDPVPGDPNNPQGGFGRWPWHRDQTAKLIDKTFEYGAKAVGLDMVFSESDPRVQDGLRQYLTSINQAPLINQFETDHDLEATIAKYPDRLVLGWTSEAMARPALCHYKSLPMPKECSEQEITRAQEAYYRGDEDKNDDGCLIPPDHPCVPSQLPQGFERFAIDGNNVDFGPRFDLRKIPVFSPITFIANIDGFNAMAKHSAYFNAFPDDDQVIRRQVLLMMHARRLYPSLSLAMARIALNDDIHVDFDENSRVKDIRFLKSGRHIPVNGQAAMEANFRGERHAFKYISAAEIMHGVPKLEDYGNSRKLAGLSPSDVLKDALVFIGVTALGNHDQRAFPFDHDTPGVEGHATALDNILAGDMIVSGFHGQATFWLYLLMIVGGLAFAYFTQRLQAIPALMLFLVAFAGFSGVDFGYLFARNNINWNTGFLYIEMFAIFVVTIAAKYVIEENDKKFVRDAFARYVAPAVVDSIMKDPKKLALGGERKELTVLFSDIRGFTTFSEKMDAKLLSSFLNDYLGIMTDIVFAEKGTLDKYIGDAVMAFWGAPLDQADHAANSCRAAVKMMQALHANTKRFKDQYGVDVAIGIGINSGNVSVGNMGSATKFNYTVIGDHVNLASRLEGLTKYYGVPIVTTRGTLEDIKKGGAPLPAHRTLDFVKVKGKKQAVELIQVLDRDLPESGLKLFEEARGLYAKQQWDVAIAKFREAEKLLALDGASDGPCAMYVERCEEFKKAPPEAGWDGSWEMHSK